MTRYLGRGYVNTLDMDLRKNLLTKQKKFSKSSFLHTLKEQRVMTRMDVLERTVMVGVFHHLIGTQNMTGGGILHGL
jgi:hypothetical protein